MIRKLWVMFRVGQVEGWSRRLVSLGSSRAARVLITILLTTALSSALHAQLTLTVDSLPIGGTYSNYTEQGMSFVASSNVFLTVSNPLNSSTAAELRNSNSFTYTFSMGGKPFSLQSLRVVTRGFGQTTVRSAFGTRTFSNVTTGLVN